MITHKPVLLLESIAGLNLRKGATIVDATLGGGGHSREILKIIGRGGRLIAIDQDRAAIENFNPEYSGQLPSEVGNVVLVKDNFSKLENILGGQGIKSVDGILADLGYSSAQLEDESYGMSFLKDAELDMRLDKENALTAKKIINEYSQADLERIIRDYGEEKFAKNIAKKIIERRKSVSIEKTIELAEIINQAIPERYRHQKIHPATRTFQALRIEVNKELENLEKFIPVAINVLSPGGRLAIISFHSLEDRIVKNIFRENARGCICPPDFPSCLCGHQAKVKIITRKPIVPGAEEIAENPRARSAKLRICEKI
ncbi:MAG: 16S rRNA (cytosine(1402)-N(4))-methyltransferase RsmH [Parcubacteria group bacterium]|jgi:16S rRNA (cytosine1402-N4)-methyltransferase